LNCTEDQFFEWLETFDYDRLETTYGIHDFSGGETDTENVVGFSSYEISKKDFITVMEIWRKGLVDAGFISPEKEVEIVESENQDFKSMFWEVKQLKNDTNQYGDMAGRIVINVSSDEEGNPVDDISWMQGTVQNEDELNELEIEEVAEGMLTYNGNLTKSQLIKELKKRGFNTK
jgi:hypothetical protein